MGLTQQLHRIAGHLADHGIETPNLEAQILLAHVLGVSREWLFAHGDEPISPTDQQKIERLLARRLQHEPVAYLTGSKAFYGRPFAVDRRVLIPRPETELLVDRAVAWLASAGLAHPLAADIGTGSGCIAVTLALEWPLLTVYGVDLSPDALAVAQGNVETLDAAARVTLLQGDLLSPLPEPVDLIVANLPYVTDGAYADLEPGVRVHEPRLALTAGPLGLDQIQRLLLQAPGHLRPGGAILLEIGYDQGESVPHLVRQHLPPSATVTLHQDWAGLDRVVAIQMG